MLALMKNAISFGNYRLLDMQQRITRLYAMGNITHDELDELLALAAEKANPDAERPEMLGLVQALSQKVDALAAEVAALKAGSSDENIQEENPCKYPSWQPWDGLSNRYQNGAIVSHKDQLWLSVYPGQNVWEPGIVDDRFWIKYDPEM